MIQPTILRRANKYTISPSFTNIKKGHKRINRITWADKRVNNSMGINIIPSSSEDKSDDNSSKINKKIDIKPTKHAYGLSVRQMAAFGLCGDQVKEKYPIEADMLTSKANLTGEVVSENTRVATRMYAGRPASQAPPDLPSLLLDGRIVYIGMPLVPSATELLISELLWLNYSQPDQPVYIYINSTGSQSQEGQTVGFETEAYAILDTMSYIRPSKYTVAVGRAFGNAAMILASGKKGKRFSLPNSHIMLAAPKLNRSYGIASNAMIKANELDHCTDTYIDFMTKFTERDREIVEKESGRNLHLTPEQAIELGVIDRIITPKDNMILERDYDTMLAQSQAVQRSMGGGGGGGDGPQTAAA